MLHYLVSLSDPEGHYIDVKLQIAIAPAEYVEQKRELILWLPTWIPGSYLIREFSRNIVSFSASLNTHPCPWDKPEKNKWCIKIPLEIASQSNAVLECQWRVYCWDLSVRGAHFDSSHAFFNGTSLFLIPEGMENEPIDLTLSRPLSPGRIQPAIWKIATGLNFADDTRPLSTGLQDGCQILKSGDSVKYSATNYDCLIDHPFEVGELQTVLFEACDVPHYFAVYGADNDLDLERICRDLKPVCEAQIKLFEPDGRAPFEAYWFLLHATDSGYGGLEHRNSTALLCNRDDLPQRTVEKAPEKYEQFMGLCSHEYFHSWNVKRIKPEVFSPYDLHKENYTKLLWVFEGFTSYYDDLMLARGGFYDEQGYLKALCKSIHQVMRGPGRYIQTVSQSSFEAWTKYYRQDENAPNSIVSYYTKGALIALCIDLTIRLSTKNTKSLDDVMRTLWNKFGKTTCGVPEGAMPLIIYESTGVDLKQALDSWTESTDELPLQQLLTEFGCELSASFGDKKCGLRINGSMNDQGLKVKNVFHGSAAHKAGVAAGDLLVSIGTRKMTETNLDRFQRSTPPGTQVELIGFRAESLMKFQLETDDPEAKEWQIEATKHSHHVRPWHPIDQE